MDDITVCLGNSTCATTFPWIESITLSSNITTVDSFNYTGVNTTAIYNPVDCKNIHYVCRRKGKLTWQFYVKIIFIPFFFAIGLFGNSLSFLVMSSKTYRRKSYSYYLRALAVFDTLTLFGILLSEVNDILFDLCLTESGIFKWHTIWTCKLTVFIRRVNFIMSSWLVMCFTLDRVIAVCFPLKRLTFCNEKFAQKALFCVFFVVMMTQSYHLYYITYIPCRKRNKHQPCHAPIETRLKYYGINYIWSNLLLRFAIPFVVIAISNGMIVCHIEHMQSLRLTEERKTSKKVNLAIYTLYAVCLTFIITLLPDSVISLLHYFIFIFNPTDIARRWSFYRPLRILEVPFHIIRLINYSMNFVLYGLTGRQFRRELKKLVLSCTRPVQGIITVKHDKTRNNYNCQIHGNNQAENNKRKCVQDNEVNENLQPALKKHNTAMNMDALSQKRKLLKPRLFLANHYEEEDGDDCF